MAEEYHDEEKAKGFPLPPADSSWGATSNTIHIGSSAFTTGSTATYLTYEPGFEYRYEEEPSKELTAEEWLDAELERVMVEL